MDLILKLDLDTIHELLLTVYNVHFSIISILKLFKIIWFYEMFSETN